jgi:predicted Zn-dependent protease
MNKPILALCLLASVPLYAQSGTPSGNAPAATPSVVVLPVTAQADDVETRAMKDELNRAMKQLQLPSLERPYYIDYKIVDQQSVIAHASLGSLTSSQQTHTRLLTVTVRVGSYQYDNSNSGNEFTKLISLFSSMATGSNTLPLDDNYDELRRKIWIATDSAYKQALQDLSAKKAAEKSKDLSKRTPDFSQEPAHLESDTLPLVDEDLANAEHLVRVSSAALHKGSSIRNSTAEFEIDNITEHFVNSEGTSYVRQMPEIYLHLTATLHGKNDENYRDVYSAHARSLTNLPTEAEILASAKQVVARLEARQKAQPFKHYKGPVLVEGEAADEVFAHNFANNFPVRPRSGLKINTSVLPEFLSVVDNPLLTSCDGQPLFGNYKFDEEGVPAQETLLVDAGIQKTLLNSRQPARNFLHSTGNMRLQGVLPSNVIVSATKSSTNAELRAQMMGVVKTRGLEYGMIVRRLSGANAIEAVRLYPDGHEEAVRDARIGDVSFKSFREIVAVSKDRTVYSEYSKESGEDVAQGFLALLGLSGLAGSTNNADLVSYVVPDLLFANLDVDHSAEGSSEKPPIPRP